MNPYQIIDLKVDKKRFMKWARSQNTKHCKTCWCTHNGPHGELDCLIERCEAWRDFVLNVK